MTNTAEINNKYVQGRLLGQGGFGKVVECTNILTNKQVAMKIVNKSRVMNYPVLA